MKRWLIRALLVAALVAAGIWIWRAVFPPPEQVIRKRLAEIARLASIAPNESPLAKLANSEKLMSYFAPDVEITVDAPGHALSVRGRNDLRAAALQARNMLSSLKVQFLDISISVASDRQNASVHLTARADIPGESVPEVEELTAAFRKVEGRWVIHHAATVRTLR